MHMPVLSEADKRFDHEVEIMKNRNPEEYFAFRRRMDVWYRQKRKILISMLQLLDIDQNQKKVSYETMKRALLDLDIPCTRVEMHAICLLLDRRNRRMITWMHQTALFVFILNSFPFCQKSICHAIFKPLYPLTCM